MRLFSAVILAATTVALLPGCGIKDEIRTLNQNVVNGNAVLREKFGKVREEVREARNDIQGLDERLSVVETGQKNLAQSSQVTLLESGIIAQVERLQVEVAATPARTVEEAMGSLNEILELVEFSDRVREVFTGSLQEEIEELKAELATIREEANKDAKQRLLDQIEALRRERVDESESSDTSPAPTEDSDQGGTLDEATQAAILQHACCSSNYLVVVRKPPPSFNYRYNPGRYVPPRATAYYPPRYYNYWVAPWQRKIYVQPRRYTQ